MDGPFLFGKAFMKELCPAGAPVIPHVSEKTLSNELSLEGNVMESSFIVSLDPQRSLPDAKFETVIDKLDDCSSFVKMNEKDGKRLGFQSQQLSLHGYTCDFFQDVALNDEFFLNEYESVIRGTKGDEDGWSNTVFSKI